MHLIDQCYNSGIFNKILQPEYGQGNEVGATGCLKCSCPICNILLENCQLCMCDQQQLCAIQYTTFCNKILLFITWLIHVCKFYLICPSSRRVQVISSMNFYKPNKDLSSKRKNIIRLKRFLAQFFACHSPQCYILLSEQF